MLKNTTRQSIKAFSAINNSVIVTYPRTVIKMGKHIQAFIDVDKLGESQFEDVGFLDFGEFNSVVDIIKDAEITESKGILKISNSNSCVNYTTTTIDIIEDSAQGNPEMIDRVKNEEKNTKVATFEIDSENFDKIKKMSGLLKDLDNFIVESIDGKINVSLMDDTRSSKSYSLNVDGSSIEEFKMVMSMDLISKIPTAAYDFSIMKSQKGSLICILDSTATNAISIVVSSKATL